MNHFNHSKAPTGYRLKEKKEKNKDVMDCICGGGIFCVSFGYVPSVDTFMDLWRASKSPVRRAGGGQTMILH